MDFVVRWPSPVSTVEPRGGSVKLDLLNLAFRALLQVLASPRELTSRAQVGYLAFFAPVRAQGFLCAPPAPTLVGKGLK